MNWLDASLSLFGLAAPRWAWIGLGLLMLVEWFLGWSHSVKANSLLGAIARLLHLVLGRIPVLGPLLEAVARPAVVPAQASSPPPIPPAVVGLLLLIGLCSLPGCGGQFRAAFDEHLAADRRSAITTMEAAKRLRAADCQANPGCIDINLRLIEAQASAVVAP